MPGEIWGDMRTLLKYLKKCQKKGRILSESRTRSNGNKLKEILIGYQEIIPDGKGDLAVDQIAKEGGRFCLTEDLQAEAWHAHARDTLVPRMFTGRELD